MRTQSRTRFIATVVMLAAVSYILAFFEVPLPIFPSFLKVDISDIPALVAAFALGPIAGIVVELVKNAFQLFGSSTFGIGELANFIIGSAFVGTAGVVYRYKHTKSGAILGCLAGTVAMALAGAALNFFVLLPLYVKFMSLPMENIIETSQVAIPLIDSKLTLILWGVVPFNIFKGLLVMVVTMFIYKPLSPILKGQRALHHTDDE